MHLPHLPRHRARARARRTGCLMFTRAPFRLHRTRRTQHHHRAMPELSEKKKDCRPRQQACPSASPLQMRYIELPRLFQRKKGRREALLRQYILSNMSNASLVEERSLPSLKGSASERRGSGYEATTSTRRRRTPQQVLRETNERKERERGRNLRLVEESRRK